MTGVDFEVLGARAEPHAAVPTIMFRLRVSEVDGRPVHALVLQCQIRIEPNRRRYLPAEETRLYELFGEVPQWGESLRPFLWTHASVTTGGFDGTTELDLPVACTYDFEVAAAKYMHGLESGCIPLVLLFSGTVFGRTATGFSAEPVSWGAEATYQLPVATWRDMMDRYFPNGGWMRVERATLDRLQRYRAVKALPTWDQALERLLDEAGVVDR